MLSPAPSPRLASSEHSRGALLVELALVLPFMLVLALTVVDLSRAFYVKSMLTSAAREGARLAVERQTPTDTSSADFRDVRSQVADVLAPVTASTGYGLSAPSVVVTLVGAQYRVSVSGSFTWLYLGALNQFSPGLFSNPQTLSASTTMRKLAG